MTQSRNPVHTRHMRTITVLIPLICFLATALIAPPIQCQSPSITPYVPAPPLGPTNGYTNISYNYTIYTTSRSAQWAFSWGDGSQSAWTSLATGTDRITLQHHWATPGTYNLKVQFKDDTTTGVWSPPLQISIAQPTDADYPQNPRLLSGALQGYTNTSYTYLITATDPHKDHLQYRTSWDNSTVSNWTTFTPSDTPFAITFSLQNAGTHTMAIQVRNTLGLTTPWATIASITVIPPGNPLTRTYRLSINRVDYILQFPAENTGWLYNTASASTTPTREVKPGTYLLDINGDGTWEYTYTPDTGSLFPYHTTATPEPLTIPVVPLLLLLTTLTIILIIGLLFKFRILYLEEVPVNKK